MFGGQDGPIEMKQGGRIVLFGTMSSILLGFLAACTIVLADESWTTIRYSLTTVRGVADLALRAMMASVPVSLPAGLAGGFVGSPDFAILCGLMAAVGGTTGAAVGAVMGLCCWHALRPEVR